MNPLDQDRILALVEKLGGWPVVEQILQDKKTVTVQNPAQRLFDKHGRRIPEGLQTDFCDPDWGFQLVQPDLETGTDFSGRILQLFGFLGFDTGITARDFMKEAERLLVIIKQDFQIADIVKGVWLPIIMPKLVSNDIGAELEQYLLELKRNYKDFDGNRRFRNFYKNELKGEISIANGSRHDLLIERMKEGPVIGIYFPSSLQGYSAEASREQMLTLPEGFVLSGLDTVVAMAMYPDVLASSGHTPNLNLAALRKKDSVYSISLKTYNRRLIFGRAARLDNARKFCSNGLLFIG